MEDKPQSFEERVIDMASAQALALHELALALHDANVIDKSVIAGRWRAAAAIEDGHVTPAMRGFLEALANILDSTKGTA